MGISVQTISSTQLDVGSEYDVIGGFSDYFEAIALLKVKQPAIILVEYDNSNDNFEQYLKNIQSLSSGSKIILLGEKLSDEIILNCMLCGIFGYLQLSSAHKFLNKSINAVHHGEAWFSRKLVSTLIESMRG